MVTFNTALPPSRSNGDPGPAADMNLIVAAIQELRSVVAGNPVTGGGGGGGTTTTAAITMGAPTVASTSVTVRWTTALGTDGVTPDSVTSARDGSDSTGAGAYSATGDPINGSRTFNNLVAGATYHFTVQLIKGGANYGTPATTTVTLAAAGTPTPTATVLASEPFSGASGAAWPLQWTVFAGSGGVVNQDGAGRGRLTSSATAYTANDSAFLSGITAVRDMDVTLDITFPVIAEEYLSVGLRFPSNTTATGYMLSIFPGAGANSLGVNTVSAGVETALSGDLAAGTWTANTARRVRFSIVGNNQRIKVWDPAATEPTTWLWSGTDTTFATATGSLWLSMGAGSAATARSALVKVVSITDGADVAGGSTGGSTGGTGGTGGTGTGTGTATGPQGPAGNWTSVFFDDFLGTSLDTTKWNTQNGRSQNAVTMSSANVSVANSELLLKLASSSSGAQVGTAVVGEGSKAGANSYLLKVGDVVEARVWFPGNGSALYNWPAWWTSGPSWPSAGEHDIAEDFENGILSVNYHSPSGASNGSGRSGYWGDAYHVYTLHRKANSADVYWDGVLARSYPTSDNGQPHGLLLTNGYGTPSSIGAVVKVDWVRAWTPA